MTPIETTVIVSLKIQSLSKIQAFSQPTLMPRRECVEHELCSVDLPVEDSADVARLFIHVVGAMLVPVAVEI